MLCLIILLFTGCSLEAKRSNLTKELGETPPQPVITFENKAISVYQSSYCWNNASKGTGTCADYAAPSEQLKDKDKDRVKAGGRLTYKFHVKNPTEITLTQSHNGTFTEVPLVGESFEVPTEKGIYYYSLSAVWLKDTKSRVSEGSSSYTFVIEVI
ncbi:hypothetical protein [Paenibacillus pectinilyticus]|nr:hypothetical protein [Paenibacillus pectinilyticus]